MVFCNDENRLYLFGGNDGEGLQGDFWRFDVESNEWTLLGRESPSNGAIPSAREGHRMAIDQKNRVIYLFGRKEG